MQGMWKLIRTNYRPGDNWLLAASKDARILESG
jgi:hypothetical protein